MNWKTYLKKKGARIGAVVLAVVLVLALIAGALKSLLTRNRVVRGLRPGTLVDANQQERVALRLPFLYVCTHATFRSRTIFEIMA